MADLIVVVVAIVMELNEEALVGHYKVIRFLRCWKVGACLFGQHTLLRAYPRLLTDTDRQILAVCTVCTLAREQPNVYVRARTQTNGQKLAHTCTRQASVPTTTRVSIIT